MLRKIKATVAKYMPGYAAWEIHPVMELEVTD